MERAGNRDVIVIGAGVVGLAVASELAGRGNDVLVLDAGRPGHLLGSSKGLSRMRVPAAFPDDSYLDRGRRAGELWRALEDESGTEILAPTGCLSWGEGQADLEAGLVRHGIEHEIWDSGDVQRRVPAMTLPAGVDAIYQPGTETVLADAALEVLLGTALGRGVELQEDTPVVSIEPDDAGVTLRTGHGPVRAETAILCAGAWMPGLLAGLGIAAPLTVTSQTVAYFELTGGGPIPGLIQYGSPDPYALWSPDGLLKASLHAPGQEVEPGTIQDPDPQTVDAVAEWVDQLFGKAVASRLVRTETCNYTSTPDERFVIERHGRIVVASACSGQGFQYAPDTAERVAALVS